MTTDDERDLAQALFRTLYDAGVSFQSNDLIPRLTATVRAAGFRRQGPITDEAVRAALSGWFRRMIAGGWDDTHEARMRAALEAAERARSAAPSTTDEWEYGAGYEHNNGIETLWFSMHSGGFTVREAAENEVERYSDSQIRLIRRRKAGPWEPVPSTTEQEKP